jgi:hypothetical protein
MHRYFQTNLFPKLKVYEEDSEISFKEWELLHIIDYHVHVKTRRDLSFL